jgi:hypothetical protein
MLALILPIIALYLLKLRRQDHVVSSTYLWQRFVRDVEANAPWQKLRRNLLLLLQILLMLLLILALARPATEASGVAGQTVVLILDTSASMAATDVDLTGLQDLSGLNAATRLDAAKAAARDLVTHLPDNARVTVLAAAGDEVNTLTSASQDRRQVLEAIASTQPTALGSDLTPALTLAEAIVARETTAEVVLFSDGAVQLPEQLSAPIRFVPIGQSRANQAISALLVSLTPTGDTTLFVQVSNYSDQPAQRRLVIQVDGSPFSALDLTVPPGGHVEPVIEALPATAQNVEAFLTPAENDFLPLDDRAWTVVRTAEPVQVTLVTAGNFFLQTALSLLNSQRLGLSIELTVVNPQDWKAGRLGSNSQPSNLPTLQSSISQTLHIFDSYVPDHLPPGNLLFIAPPTSVPGLFEVEGQTTHPIVHPIEVDHPFLQNIDLSELQILTATVVSATHWGGVVVGGEIQPNLPTPIPLLLAGEVEGRRIAILTFALQQSDLPLRPAFPILVANLVNYLAPSAASLVPTELSPGEALSISVPLQVKRLRWVTPSGAERIAEAEAGRVSLPPLTQLGLYTLAFEPAGSVASTLTPTSLAVNFFDPLESAIAPRPELDLTDPATSGLSSVPPPPAQREWWWPLALGVLILLVVEWLVYQRSAVLKYWTMTRQRLTTKA